MLSTTADRMADPHRIPSAAVRVSLPVAASNCSARNSQHAGPFRRPPPAQTVRVRRKSSPIPTWFRAAVTVSAWSSRARVAACRAASEPPRRTNDDGAGFKSQRAGPGRTPIWWTPMTATEIRSRDLFSIAAFAFTAP
jgi:hypothetical protein